MTSIGWGKVILLGEHAVVYGYPALAAALDRGVTMGAIPTPKGGPLRLDVPAWELAVTAGSTADHPVARALAAIADALGAGRPALSLVGEAQIPHSAGLGSSAALAVAVARAMLVAANRAPDPALIDAAAAASETLLHGRPSGVDAALAAAGGVGVFRRAAGLRPIPTPPLRVLVGPSGMPRSTSAMVEAVAAAVGGNASDARLAELGALTDDGTAALLASDLPRLGAAMSRAHEVLAGLGVSNPRLDSLCEAARAAGAHGAKLTGAGGGGAVIAIAPREKEAAVLTEWRATDVNGFVATIGG
ncbi:MAG: mevalonate kinase [Deltaproteobacteria bacterium]|nr:mevalonate kinase [Deltaproteobacteria bacterium]